MGSAVDLVGHGVEGLSLLEAGRDGLPGSELLLLGTRVIAKTADVTRLCNSSWGTDWPWVVLSPTVWDTQLSASVQTAWGKNMISTIILQRVALDFWE